MNTGFATNTPFGVSSTFKPNTFGGNSFGSTSGSQLFTSSTTQQSGGLFSTPAATSAFGQPQTSQPAFGNTGGLFGTQQNATPGMGLFGSSSNSTFGQSKPFGFGTQPQSTGLFGQPQPQPAQPQQTSLFGQPAAQSTSGLFSTPSSFGSNAPQGGTTIKFTPVTGTDTMVKNGTSTNINTRHHCITCMKEYEGKSLEELRLEDYVANRKGPQQGSQSGLGLFGSTNQPSFFGSSSTSGFGSATNTGVFGATNTGNTLFGKPAGTATAFGTPASTTASTFGFNSTTSTNPFGTSTAQKPFSATPQTGLFGQTTQASTGFGTQPTSGFGGFGTQQNTGGLFGAAKPSFNLGGTNTSSTFSFNQPSTTATSNLFGAKPPTSSFGSFGTPATTSTGFGTAGFGNTNQNSTLFGNTGFGKPNTGFSFGATPTPNTLGGGLNLGGGSTLFGNNAQKPGGLFGQTNTNPFGTSSFGNTTSAFNTGSSSLGGMGGNTLMGLGNQQPGLSNSQNNPINQHLLAYASMPFGDSPLFKNLLPTSSGKTDELLKPTSPAAQKALITGQNFKASPKSNSKVKVVPIEATTKKSLFDGLDGEEEESFDGIGQGTVRQSPKRLVLRPRPLSEISINQRNQLGTSVNADMTPIIRTYPRFSLNTPVSSRSGGAEHSTDGNDSAKSPVLQGQGKITLHIRKSLESQPGRPEDTMVELCPPKENPGSSSPLSNSINHETSKGDNTTDQPSATSRSLDSELEDCVAGLLDDSGPPHPARIILRREGYYTIPDMERLGQLVDSEGRCIVDNFTVGRLKYGNVFFPDRMDVAALNLDEIVHFRHKEVVVYPDDSNKPPVGEGLNRKAQVTLDRVWPVDKTTRLPITDPVRIEAMDYEGKLRRASAKYGTKFVEYRPQTGSWVFKVEHFSKYGLSDSDEDEPPPSEVKKQKLTKPTLQGTTVPQHPIKQSGPPPPPPTLQIIDEDEDMEYDGIRSPFDLDEKFEGSMVSPTAKLGRAIEASSHKVQLMKASFFDQSDLNIDGEYFEYDDMLQDPTYKVHGYSFDSRKLAEALSWYKRGQIDPKLPGQPFISMDIPDEDDRFEDRGTEQDRSMKQTDAHILAEELQEGMKSSYLPKAYTLHHLRSALPLKDMSAGRIDSVSLVDVDLYRGRTFVSKWAQGSRFICQAPSSAQTPSEVLLGRLANDFSLPQIHFLSVTSCHDLMKVSTESHLASSHKHSILEIKQDGCPHFSPKPGLAGLHDHYSIATHLAKVDPSPEAVHISNIWGLCHALWGRLPIEDNPESHLTLQQRKTAVSDWLKSVVRNSVLDEITRNENNIEEPNEVFSYLSGYQVSEACDSAQNSGDHHLSLMISQSRSSGVSSVRVRQQLLQWRDTEADHFIDSARLKALMLVAGLPIHSASERNISVCSSLDWLRAFGIYLWYVTGLTASVTDALLAYEKAWKEEKHAPCPVPLHKNDESSDVVYDVQYHLLKLFSSKSHPIEPILNPASYTSDHLDYSLSWFLLRMLSSLGYSHASELAACMVHSSFADQLEAQGLWHYGVFVLLHIPDDQRRKDSILNMIERHVSAGEKTEEEDYLISKLKIPQSWIYSSKARKALFLKRYDDAAKFLLKAEAWNEAHSVIMNHISSRAIINEKYDYLKELLTEIEKRESECNEWGSGGGIVLEYLRIICEIESLVEAQNLDIGLRLQQLQPKIIQLCKNIKLLSTATPVDRLSQAEMAKRISGLIQSLIVAHWRDETDKGVSMLAGLVNELPLASDHSQWEWLRVMASWRVSASHPT